MGRSNKCDAPRHRAQQVRILTDDPAGRWAAGETGWLLYRTDEEERSDYRVLLEGAEEVHTPDHAVRDLTRVRVVPREHVELIR